MRRFVVVFVLFLVVAPSALGASGARSTENLIGTPRGIVRASDKGFFLVDEQTVTRIKSDDSVAWSRQFPGEAAIRFAAAAAGDDLYVGGFCLAGGGRVAGWLARISGTGAIVWSRQFGAEHANVMFHSGASLTDGGIAVCGAMEQDGVVVRLAADGTLKWQKAFSVRYGSRMISIAATRDGGLVVGGEGSPAPLVAKLDRNGAMQWHRTIGRFEGAVTALSVTRDGIIAAGQTQREALTSLNGMVVKLANDGRTVW